jgi:hypothetical protein
MNNPRRTVRILPLGGLGNRMIQHMVALSIISGIEGGRIQGYGLPEWDIVHDTPDDAPPDLVLEGQQLDVEAARAILRRPGGGLVHLHGYGQQFRNFPTVEVARSTFPVPASLDTLDGYGDDKLVIHIRGNDILDAIQRHYTLLPVTFYVDIVRRTGLKPVFRGQIGTGPYFEELRAAFPAAEFVMSQRVMTDFTILRRSRNIMVSVSTFSWLAAWLSEAAQIHLPVCGLFNPMQIPEIDLLPLADPRYAFHLFPITYAVLPDRVRSAHAALNGLWREVPADFLDIVRTGAPRVARSREAHLAMFNEHEYLSQHPGIADIVRSGAFTNGLAHYQARGYDERCSPCAFDRVWYACNYPLATLEVTEGDYSDLFHHWIVIGRKRGYRPTPPPAHCVDEA